MASGLRDVPHQQAGYMAAPTSIAFHKETLAKPEPSIHGPLRRCAAAQQVGSCRGHSGTGQRRGLNFDQ